MIYTMEYVSPVGKLLLAAKDDFLTGLWIEDQKYFLSTIKEEYMTAGNCKTLITARYWLDRYFAGDKPEIGELKLKPEGSEFAKSVWKLLCKIPYGKTSTYGDIAEKLAELNEGKQMSARAVGGAVGRNPISIIIPCHRVIGANGKLTGYAGGLDKKIKLLYIEKYYSDNR